MKHPITVKVLVTVNDPTHFDACTLCFESLRVGWPTADIHVYVNGGAYYGDIAAKFERGCLGDIYATKPIHHAEWIREQVSKDYPGPLVIADPDIVYWKSCEAWEFDKETLLAGYYNPRIWNDFAKCISVPRIHTSMMVFPDVQKLWTSICHAYPLANMRHGEYCPCDPFMPAVRFDDGHPTFWDSCANLFNMLWSFCPKRLVQTFTRSEKECFDHLNSASFHQVMGARLDTDHRLGFIAAHQQWVANPQPGLWPLVDEYYKQKEIEGWMKQPGDRTLKV